MYVAKTVAAENVSQLSDKQLIISWPGHQITMSLSEPIMHLGRKAKGNQIVIDYPVVSRYHATLKWDKGGYHIIDGQARNNQHKPSSNGLYFEGKRIKEHRLQNGDIIRIPDRNQNFIMLMYFDASASPLAETERIWLDKEITIGRDKRNDLHLKSDPIISAFHAIVAPSGQGHIVRDMDSSNGTYVNGNRTSQITLQVNDIIQLGSVQLRYTGSELIPVNLSREGIRLEAIAVRKQVKVKSQADSNSGHKVLLDNISLVVEPREFVTLVGVSGAGKSTLLDAMNGSRPTEGQVLINGQNLYKHFDAYRQGIGYVPQDDIIHRELTVEEALNYVARLRLPSDTPDDEIQDRIDRVLEQVAMSGQKNVLVKQLSGGQRKRVSIAVELIADPGIIFLDEPTSGLDPGLDKKMMFTLKQLAQSGKTVVLVTHATGNITECDMVAFLAAGGRLVFYGPPKTALTFFDVTDFAEIYNQVEITPDKWIKKFTDSAYYQQYVQQRLELSDLTEQTQVKPTTIRKRKGSPTKKIKTAVHQTKILTGRYVTMLFRDRRNLLILILQAPLIGLLLYLVIDKPGLFSECAQDIAESGFDTCQFSLTKVSEIQKILFLIACVAAWFGVINAIREIVKELPIYRRERLVNLSIPAYVSSKLIVLFGLSLIQALMLVLLIHLRATFPAKGVILPGVVEAFITMLLVTFAAASLGLFLSAVLGREDRVMSVIPLFLIPQIVFAGIIFPFNAGEAKTGSGEADTVQVAVTTKDEQAICDGFDPACYVSLFTFSRWGIEALGSTVNLPQMWAGAEFSSPISADSKLPFPFTAKLSYLGRNWAILVGFIIFSIALTMATLRRQDVH